jgi:hypothetical protein
MVFFKEINIDTIKTNFRNIKSQMINSYPEYKMMKDDKEDVSNTIYVKQKQRNDELFDNLEKMEVGLNARVLMNKDKIKLSKKDIDDVKKTTSNYKKNKFNDIFQKNLSGKVLKMDKFNENIEEYLNMSFYCFGIILLFGFIYNKQIKN